MPYRVNLTGPLRFNPTGFGKEVLEFEAGENVGPDSLATFLWENPGIGEVIEAIEDEESDESSQAAVAPADADFLAGNVGAIAARVETEGDAERLARLRAIEAAAARPRKGVIEAIDTRLEELAEKTRDTDGSESGGE